MVVLDGGMSNALEDRGHDLRDPLWTARLLRDAPEEIRAVHRAYFAAGARVATTASYQASVAGFTAAGLDRAEAERLIGRSVTLAREARDEMTDHGTPRWVAASIGPYGAVLADGSEYRGHYDVSTATLRDFHRSRVELLAAADPDFFAVETIPDMAEAEVLVDALEKLRLPAWFSYSVDGPHTRAGQPLADSFDVVAGNNAVFAAGVNCCRPADVVPALRIATARTGKVAVAYPNSGEIWQRESRRRQGAPAYDAGRAVEWVADGAAYVGGCCRVGPADIAALAAAVTGC